MRAATVALVAIPVVLGGLGIAFVAGGIDPLDASVPASEDNPITEDNPVAPDTTSDGSSRDSDSGTTIDGQRPHLSVIDGHANLFLPAPLPAIISPLPGGATELQPLPPARDSSDPSSSPRSRTGSGNGSDTAERQATPATSTESGTGPDARPARGAVPPPQAPAGTRPSASPPRTPDVPAAGRPPHADTRGRPPHAGQPGQPDHANGKHNGNSNSNGKHSRNLAGKADHNDNRSPGQAATGSRPDHGGTGGRPDHAAGGARKSDDSRPGPR